MIVAPSALFFFQRLLLETDPSCNILFVTLYGPQRGPLIRESPTSELPGKMGTVDPDPILQTDHLTDLGDSPATGLEAMQSGIALKNVLNFLLLVRGEELRAASGTGSAERFLTTVAYTGTPGTNSHLSHTEMSGQISSGPVGIIQEGLSSQTALFLLSAGETSGSPSRKRHTLCYQLKHKSIKCV